MQIEVSWGEVESEDLGYILEVDPPGPADALAVERQDGKGESEVTRVFST